MPCSNVRLSQIYDTDNSGTVSSTEIQAAIASSTALYGKRGSVLMASRLTHDDVAEVVASADQGMAFERVGAHFLLIVVPTRCRVVCFHCTDSNAVLDFDEFVAMMEGTFGVLEPSKSTTPAAATVGGGHTSNAKK